MTTETASVALNRITCHNP